MTVEHVPVSQTQNPVSSELDEAVHRCLVAGFEGTSAFPDTLKRLIDRGLGGAILFTRNVRDAEQVRELTADGAVGNPVRTGRQGDLDGAAAAVTLRRAR